MIKHRIRDLGLRVVPRLMSEILSYRSQQLVMRLERETGRIAASRAFCDSHGQGVKSGPFAGMRYPDATVQTRNLIPKILGSYESEIYPWIDEVLKQDYRTVVNVGCADGYYAVGLAMCMPHTRIIAFDTDVWARSSTRLLAIENKVQNVRVEAMCTPKWLNGNLERDSFLLVDCEGYERVLLDPSASPCLYDCDILVELHEHLVPGLMDTIQTRFISTHRIAFVTSVEKDPADFPALSVVPPSMREKVISEGRHAVQTWLYLKRAQHDHD